MIMIYDIENQGADLKSVDYIRYDVGGKETWFPIPNGMLTVTENGDEEVKDETIRT